MKRLPGLPQTITSRFLATLAEPDEEFAMVVSVQSAPFGLGPLTVPGSTQYTYQYIIGRGQSCHRLIIPLSVWKADKQKIARDIFEMPDPSVILLPDVERWEDVYTEATGGQTLCRLDQIDKLIEEAPKEAIDPEYREIEAPKEPALTKKEELLSQAEELGVSIDKRWGEAKLQEAIDEFKANNSDLEE